MSASGGSAIAGRRRRVASGRRWLSTLLALVLVACATPQPPWSAADRSAQREALAAMPTISLLGRLAVWNDREAYSGRVTWDRDASGERVRFVAPLGAARWALDVPAVGPASLRRDERTPTIASTPDALLARMLGLPVPFTMVSAWLVGLPGNADDVRQDDAGRLGSLRFRDDGGRDWDVRFDRYESIDGVWLPGRIRASQASNSSIATDSRWQLRWRLQSATAEPASTRPDAPRRLGIPGA